MIEARRRFRVLSHLAASVVLVALWLGSCAPRGSDRDSLHGRDLILVTVDTLRADAVGAYNPEAGPTPAIDALAERGLLFARALAPMPRTTPSLATLLSGRSPKHHGSREVGVPMSTDVPLVSQVLRRRDGFQTESGPTESVPTESLVPYVNVAVTASLAAAGDHGLARGFDVFRLLPGQHPNAETVTRTALELAGEALESDDNTGRPLFLWVHYVDPHFPYEPLEGEDAHAEPDACARAISTSGVSAAVVYLDHDGVSSRALDSCRSRYYGEISRVDRAIDRLFEGLRELGRPPEESLVVFTSDHGEHLGETGFFFEHGPSVHDAALRVPLIVAGPGIAPGRSEQLVELQDVAPTVSTLLGVRPEAMPPMDGRSLADRWLGWDKDPSNGPLVFAESNSNLRAQVWNTVVSGRLDRHCVHDSPWSLCGAGSQLEDFSLYDHEADPWFRTEVTEEHPEIVERLWQQRQTWPPETARERSVRDARFKLVETPLPRGGYDRRLYDLRTDPAESRDVSSDHPEVAERLGRALDEYVADLSVPGHVARDEEELDALRALGYVD